MSEINDQSRVHDYVTTHIDEAIANEWIKVYYQPVVRALTGQLCGAESLARWIDPEAGFLPPDKFIGALEESNSIYKLDCFVVEKVCSDIHERLVKGLPAFPVSVNFSRIDFTMCDMLRLIEDVIEKYDIPRDYIHIEITESMIVKDEDLMTNVIESFRSRGYEIWMDDFGSGYSSLTLLKDYHFDLLKLDMRFLSTMTDRSKTILRSTVRMAKDIGMKTLSEGVETIEQIEFLTSIGCGKLQGFFYGKPMPLEEMLEHIEKKGIVIEERQWRDYYECASMIIHDTETPLEIVEYDGDSFRTLFINEAFKQQISLRTDDLKTIDKAMYNTGSPNTAKFKQFAEKAIGSKSQESFYFTDMGNYYNLKVTYLAENNGRYLFKNSVSNISIDRNTSERDRLDSRLRELNNLYEVVLLMNYKENVIVPLLGGYVYVNMASTTEMTLDRACSSFAQRFVYPDDMEAFKDFMNSETLEEREKASKRGFIKNSFRVKQKNGSYKWRELAMLSIPGTGGNEYLFTISTVSDEIAKAMDACSYREGLIGSKDTDEVTREYARLWENLLNSSTYKIFWKDKERRFRGVSRSFLDFYDIESLDEIIGKTDEEMKWHVNDGPYQGDELDVIGKGKIVSNAQGQCIVNGVVHNIFCNKIPVYDKGEIIGLMGNFADMDQEIYRVQKLLNPSKLDNITRLTNSKEFVNTMIDYAMQFNDEGRNYGLIILHNANHRRIEETYGNKLAAKVVKEIGEKIIDIIGQRAVAARLKEAYFGVIIYIESMDKLEELTEELKKHIEEINKVDEKSVTIKMTAVCHLRTEEGMSDESIYQISLNDIQEKEASN